MAKEPEIKVEEIGSIPESELPVGAKVIEMPSQEQPKKRMVKDVLIEDINFLRGMHFNTDEVEKFGLIIVKIKQDLISCVEAIERDERAKEDNGNGNPDA